MAVILTGGLVPMGAGAQTPDLASTLAPQLANSVGYAYCHVDGTAVVASGAEGWARASWETEAPSIEMTTATRVPAGSVSKVPAAAALLSLLQSRGAPADARVGDLLGPDFASLQERSRQLTVHHLLTHTSGFNFSPERLDDPYRPHLAKLLEAGPPRPPGGSPTPIRRPGAAPPADTVAMAVYSNVNYWIVRALVEDLSGSPYEQAIAEAVFNPASLTPWTSDPGAGPLPLGYALSAPGAPGSNSQTREQRAHWAGPAGLEAAVCDMAKLGGALADDGPLGEVGRQMRARGWGLEVHEGRRGAYHFHDGVSLDGGRTGFESALVLLPDGSAIAAVSNTWANRVVSARIIEAVDGTSDR